MIEMIPYVQIRGRIWNIMVISTIWTVATSASGQQNPPGFISIDCGNTTQHKDSVTNLTWETDEKYMSSGPASGSNGVVLFPVDSRATNVEALRTFRYFSKAESKYCYELPMTTGNISVLIRAMFLHGNSPLLPLPSIFKVFVNATFWKTVRYDFDASWASRYTPTVIEGIFHSPGNVSNVCLVPDQGVPFISSLELRQLDPEGVMYSISNNKKAQFLSSLVRYNLGEYGSTVRYPDDTYDRLWNNYSDPAYRIFEYSSQKENANTSSSLNNVPPKVMMDAFSVGGSIWGLSILLPLPLDTTTGIERSSYIHVILYCQAVNRSRGLNMVLALDDEETEPFNVTDIPVMKHFSHFGLSTNTVYIGISSLMGSGAVLNAMEIYEEIVVDRSATYAGEVSLITFLKRTFGWSFWQADPCFPAPDSWITCGENPYDPQEKGYIESLNLSNLKESARLQNSASLIVGSTLSWMQALTITDSQLDDSTFQFLIENFTANGATRFEHLNLSHNNITTFPSATSWSWPYIGYAKRLLCDSIDLSHNSFTGEVLSFSTFNTPDGTTSLTKLNLSYNSFTSFSKFWGNSSYGLLNLTVLDLSHNSISSNIASLSELVNRNPSLEEVHLSYNSLTGVFPSDLYFSRQKLPKLRQVNVARNRVTGALDLTTWYQGLEQPGDVLNESLNRQLYSFVDNHISDIIPSADILRPKVEHLMRNDRLRGSGVLLGGNPYCKDAKSWTQRYLCRSSFDDILYDKKKKEANIVVIVSTTLGAIVVILLSSIVFIVIWRLWGQLSITSRLLREVQQELMNRKVQPPFYSYHDLKVATRDFHDDNKLGFGAFGAVYKGILSDGSTVAVKRLFNADKAQVLNEFLSEVALISGIKHKHLIQLKGCCIKDEERILVYEFAAKGNLAEALWGKNRVPILNWTHRINVAVGIARGLSYLHEELQPRIIHRDIKAVNIILDENFNAKIADFGLAKAFTEEETRAQFTAVAGTRGYFAPEYALEGQLTIKADVYSFGILLLEIVTGRKCIDSTASSDRVYIKTWAEDRRKSGTLLELLQPGLRDTAPKEVFLKIINIALSCIRTKPNFRPTMSQVVTMLLGNLEAQNVWEKDGSSDEDDINFESLEESTSMSIFGINYRRRGITHEDPE